MTLAKNLTSDHKDKLLEPSFLNRIREMAAPIVDAITKGAPHAEIWVGETAAGNFIYSLNQ